MRPVLYTLNPADLRGAIKKGSKTLARLWEVIRKDGLIQRFTNFDRDIEVPGFGLFISTPSFSPQAIMNTTGVGISNTEVKFVFTSDESTGFIERDVVAGLYDNAKFSIHVVDWEHPEYGTMALMYGNIGNVSWSNDGTGSFTCSGILSSGDKYLGELYSPSCRADLFDNRCKLPVTGFSWSDSVSVGGSNMVFQFINGDTNLVEGVLNGGTIVFDSINAANAAAAMEILSHTITGVDNHIITLILPLPREIQVVDNFIAYAGCDKRRETCKGKFNNLVNFRGEPWVPGSDATINYPI